MNSASVRPAPWRSALQSSSSDEPSAESKSALRLGSLCAEVLSAYDLPHSEAPQCVALTTTLSPALTLHTGAPLARHKNRNSFRFSAPSGSHAASSSSPSSSLVSTGESNASSVMELVAPLRDLYKSKATIRVVYASKEPLQATYDLDQLRIHETKWVILALSSDNAPTPLADGTEEEIPPTIRVKLTLSGPYRPEIAGIVASAQAWFRFVDGLEQKTLKVWQGAPKPPFDLSKAMILPVPLLALAVVVSPVLASLIMLSLPFLLPVVLLIIATTVGALFAGASLFFSTKFGRDHLGAVVAPLVDSFLHSKAGQSVVYDVGPRPTPVSVAKQILPTGMWGKLVISLLIDLVGSSSYLLPLIGEVLDIAWAPVQTILVMAMYENVTPNLKYVSFFEEILPLTDVVPTATIGWACQFVPQLLGHDIDLARGMDYLVSTTGSHPIGIIRKDD